DGDGEFGVAGELGDHVERDGFDGRAAVAAVGGHSVDIRVRDHRVEVDPHDRVDRVYQRDGVGTALHRGHCRRADVGYVGRELDDDGELGDLLDPLGDHAGVLGYLAHCGPHSAFAHAVGAAEVKLKAVGPGILATFDDL